MPSGGFGNPSIFPKNRLFCIFKLQFSKNFQNFQKNLENFFEKKFFFGKKNFFEKIFWKKFWKILKIWPPKPLKFTFYCIFKKEILPKNTPLVVLVLQKRPSRWFRPPPWQRPPLQHLWYYCCNIEQIFIHHVISRFGPEML